MILEPEPDENAFSYWQGLLIGFVLGAAVLAALILLDKWVLR